MRSFVPLIFVSVSNTYGSSRDASMRCKSLTKYGEMYPRSNCIPSVYSTSIFRLLPSSTVITPSWPTFFMA